MTIEKLSTKVTDSLGYYVYLYVNPLDERVFYVGKGQGNRVLSHLNDSKESQKTKIIQEIRKQGLEPRIEILVHGLTDESMALRIEAAAIDLLGIANLTNQVHGWESNIVGRMGINDLVALYDSAPAQIDDSVLLIRINRLYHYGMSDLELYEATRGVWKLGERRNKARYALAVYRGLVREVFCARKWHPAGTTQYHTRPAADVIVPGRWEFEGEVAPEAFRLKYKDKSVGQYFPANSQNPVMYIGC